MVDERAQRLHETRTVNDTLNITIEEATPESVVLSVPVGPDVHQPYGILHGGVSALLAEGAASVAGALNVREDQIVVGTELNISHLRPLSEGTLRARATPIRLGRSVHVWGIELRDHRERLISTARCSLQVLAAPASREA